MRRYSIYALQIACSFWAASAASGQQLTLQSALQRARGTHPTIAAAREAVNAARAREQQAGTWPNPTLSYSREQASHKELRSSQDIVSLDQRIEIGGQRSARAEAARLRRESAEARLSAAQADIELEVFRAYAGAVTADRRAALASQAAAAFVSARRNSDQRLAAGDISGYAARRLKLEAARYTALSVEARQEQHTARLGLASLLTLSPDSADSVRLSGISAKALSLSVDSIDSLIRRQTYEVSAARLDADAFLADARLAQRERTPSPTVIAGFKRESSNATARLNGFVAGLSIPLPLLDRRTGAIAAAEAEHRRRTAEVEALQRTLALTARAAFAATNTIEQQVEALRAELGEESRLALTAAEVAYAEGEITLIEWLDAVRAYQEAGASYAGLSAHALIQRATLLRMLGLPISEE
jgi:outer membrane protein, heavy metal efflux system